MAAKKKLEEEELAKKKAEEEADKYSGEDMETPDERLARREAELKKKEKEIEERK